MNDSDLLIVLGGGLIVGLGILLSIPPKKEDPKTEDSLPINIPHTEIIKPALELKFKPMELYDNASLEYLIESAKEDNMPNLSLNKFKQSFSSIISERVIHHGMNYESSLWFIALGIPFYYYGTDVYKLMEHEVLGLEERIYNKYGPLYDFMPYNENLFSTKFIRGYTLNEIINDNKYYNKDYIHYAGPYSPWKFLKFFISFTNEINFPIITLGINEINNEAAVLNYIEMYKNESFVNPELQIMLRDKIFEMTYELKLQNRISPNILLEGNFSPIELKILTE